MRASHIFSMVGVAGVLAVTCAPNAMPEPTKTPAPSCFFSRDWQGWKASADDKSIFIRVGRSNIYRLDLSSPCTDLHGPDVHLVTRIRGGDTICNAMDIDLKVAQGHDFAVSCIVEKLTQLSREEAAALPKNLQP